MFGALATLGAVNPAVFELERASFGHEPFSVDEMANMERYVYLTDELRRCRYFTEEERTMNVTMVKGVTTSFEQKMPDRGSTRDVLGVMRQLFGDGERASFASVVAILRRHADSTSPEGQQLLSTLDSFDGLRRHVLASWALAIRTSEDEAPLPVDVFLDWMYGEFWHSDAHRAARIERLDGPFRFYEWQFHWVSERLASVFTRFASVVAAALRTTRLA
jgi:hypothetical protein